MKEVIKPFPEEFKVLTVGISGLTARVLEKAPINEEKYLVLAVRSDEVFEVGYISWHKRQEAVRGGNNIVYGDKWQYFSNEDFGVNAWSYTVFDNAKRKFMELFRKDYYIDRK